MSLVKIPSFSSSFFLLFYTTLYSASVAEVTNGVINKTGETEETNSVSSSFSSPVMKKNLQILMIFYYSRNRMISTST